MPDTLALALAAAARRAFVRGLLHGYRTEEEALHTVRGRIRFDEQMRRRSGVPLPVEVRYDEFTDDILENRLVKAAVVSLGGTFAGRAAGVGGGLPVYSTTSGRSSILPARSLRYVLTG